MIEKYQGELLNLYNNRYNETLKPLLATVESLYEGQPIVIFNEIRSFNDHIARCYRPNVSEDFIRENLAKAESHLKRAILDCFKHLNVHYFEVGRKFERDYRNVDLTTISNGEFYVNYRRLKQLAVNAVRDAKKLETVDIEKAFSAYQDAYNKYVALDDFINQNITNIDWAKTKFTVKRILKFVAWLLSAIIAGIISVAVGLFYGRISELVKTFFK
jgi:hypothetical protein